MPNIVPISDLRNYTDVLHSVSPESPVFLTKNGRGRYAILDIDEYERLMSTVRLLSELARGRKSAAEQGTIPLDEAMRMLGVDDDV